MAHRQQAANAQAPKSNPVLLVILAAALIIRLAVALITRQRHLISPDTVTYVRMAHDLSGYLHLHNTAFATGLQRTPIYPLFLTAVFKITGNSIRWAAAIQAVIGTGLVYLTWRLTTIILPNSRWAPLAAAAIIAIDPVSIAYTVAILAEVLFAVLLTGGLILWIEGIRNRSTSKLVTAGLIWAAATLTRPVLLYMPLLLVIAALITERERWRALLPALALFLVAFVVPVGGWALKNRAQTGVTMVSSIQGYNVLEFRAAGAVEEAKGIPLTRAQAEVTAELHVPPGENPGRVAQAQQTLGIRIIRQNLTGYAKEAVNGAIKLLFGGEDLGGSRMREVDITFEGLLTVLAAVGLSVLWWRRRLEAFVPIAVLGAYILVVSAGAEAYARFRTPLMPMIALLAGCSAELAVRRWSADGTPTLAPTVGFDAV
jgi:4-amino-4-deoxy-L-arabinose transferase-like glycosyltransferase